MGKSRGTSAWGLSRDVVVVCVPVFQYIRTFRHLRRRGSASADNYGKGLLKPPTEDRARQPRQKNGRVANDLSRYTCLLECEGTPATIRKDGHPWGDLQHQIAPPRSPRRDDEIRRMTKGNERNSRGATCFVVGASILTALGSELPCALVRTAQLRRMVRLACAYEESVRIRELAENGRYDGSRRQTASNSSSPLHATRHQGIPRMVMMMWVG